MKKEIEKALKKERNMYLKEEKILVYRFSNGQELRLFRNDELNMNILELVFHESVFNGLTGKYEDRTKEVSIVSRNFEGIVEEIIDINKKYFEDRTNKEVGFYCGKIGKVLQ